jgi:demethylmenaquinone methyltransferase / 2-methoxy-6-polyprenyl-1,4-benzoquinol methylase
VILDVLRKFFDGADCALEDAGQALGPGCTERVQVLGRRQPWRSAEQLVGYDLLGDLADRRDGDRLTHAFATGDRLAFSVDRDPGAGCPVVGRECDQKDALAGLRLGREDGLDHLAGRGEPAGGSRRALHVVVERHAASIDSDGMAEAVSARALFAPLGPSYDRYAGILSFGQDPRWRRFLVSRVQAGPGDTVLDVATGTGAVARELIRQKGCRVVGVDVTPEMLAEARRRLGADVELVEASAESLPFPDASFDGLTFTYLLRYVDDPAATLRELARVVRPGGTIASLEFGLPRGLWRPLWEAHVRVLLPAAGWAISPGWRRVGDFLGDSIRDLYRRLPEERLLELWDAAGIADVQARRLSLGGGLVVSGARR